MEKYSVWVGGTEINDHYLTKVQAQQCVEYWTNEGYDDVAITEREQQ